MKNFICRLKHVKGYTSAAFEDTKDIYMKINGLNRQREFRKTEKCNEFLWHRRRLMLQAMRNINQFKYRYLDGHEEVAPGDQILTMVRNVWIPAKQGSFGVRAKHYLRVRRKWKKT